MQYFFVLIVFLSLSQPLTSLAEQVAASSGSDISVEQVDVRILTLQAARGEAPALAELIERAKHGDSKAQSALVAVAAQQLTDSVQAVVPVDAQSLVLKASSGDPAAKAALVAMARQGNSLALEVLAANQNSLTNPAAQSAGKPSPQPNVNNSAVAAVNIEPASTAAENTSSANIDPRLLALLPPSVMASVKQMAMLEKDPNMDDEFQHILYWMGENRRCQVTKNNRSVSVMGVMVMLEKNYQQFKSVLPNLESLLMLAAAPRNDDSENAGAPMILRCRNQQPVNLVDWVIPEIHRYRASRL